MRDREGASSAADVDRDYRLPKTVKPRRYEIRLEPDLRAFTFKGEESIDIAVNQPTREVVLNALELEIDHASVERDGSSLNGGVLFDPKLERATIRFDRELQPGDWRLKLSFRGILNDKLHGFYRSQYQDSS